MSRQENAASAAMGDGWIGLVGKDAGDPHAAISDAVDDVIWEAVKV